MEGPERKKMSCKWYLDLKCGDLLCCLTLRSYHFTGRGRLFFLGGRIVLVSQRGDQFFSWVKGGEPEVFEGHGGGGGNRIFPQIGTIFVDPPLLVANFC